MKPPWVGRWQAQRAAFQMLSPWVTVCWDSSLDKPSPLHVLGIKPRGVSPGEGENKPWSHPWSIMTSFKIMAHRLATLTMAFHYFPWSLHANVGIPEIKPQSLSYVSFTNHLSLSSHDVMLHKLHCRKCCSIKHKYAVCNWNTLTL